MNIEKKPFNQFVIDWFLSLSVFAFTATMLGILVYLGISLRDQRTFNQQVMETLRQNLERQEGPVSQNGTGKTIQFE